MQTVSKQSGTTSAWTSSSPCGSRERSGFSFGVLERPRYYPRQLMTPTELELEADYFRDRLRRHNFYLHGWGVVCGALVCVIPAQRPSADRPNGQRAQPNDEPDKSGNDFARENDYESWRVRVNPGYVLGPYGDEINIDRSIDIDLRGTGSSGCGGDSGDDLSEPWCSEVFVDRPVGKIYVAVRYEECRVRPVRAQPSGCGCDDTACEYSRFRDGFKIGLLDCCPSSHHPDAADDGLMRGFGNPECPPCPESPWVVLAEVEVNTDGRITKIDNCSCRRIVFSARERWMQCTGTDCDQPRQTVRPEPRVPPAEEGPPRPDGEPVGTGTIAPADVQDQPPKRRRRNQ